MHTRVHVSAYTGTCTYVCRRNEAVSTQVVMFGFEPSEQRSRTVHTYFPEASAALSVV